MCINKAAKICYSFTQLQIALSINVMKFASLLLSGLWSNSPLKGSVGEVGCLKVMFNAIETDIFIL